MTGTIEPMVLDDEEKKELAQRLVAQAREAGINLVGPDGLLAGLIKQVLETALEEELTDHLGYGPGDRQGKAGTNERNGTRTKTVITEIGPVQIDVPRDSTFEPGIVKKRQRRLGGVDELVLSLFDWICWAGALGQTSEGAWGRRRSTSCTAHCRRQRSSAASR